MYSIHTSTHYLRAHKENRCSKIDDGFGILPERGSCHKYHTCQISKNTQLCKRQGSLYERDFKKSYFGSHYPKLKKIKEKYDPSSLFVVASGVGSDEWDAELRCRK